MKKSVRSSALLPLGALAAGFGLSAAALAQTPPPAPQELPTVKAKAKKEEQGKDSLQATETQIGKGKQELRDIPQSITVVTEKLMDDRNLDTLKDVLKQTSGISFLAPEGGEEDIRLRGFPLQATGDVFVDGMRDPAFYERDTFFYDRVEVLRGSASLLFGRGSTGGAVNQVLKTPRLIDQHQVDLTIGSHDHFRAVGDFNLRLDDNSAIRFGTMLTKAENNGSGARIDKQGIAAAWRTGIGERNEFLVSLYHLDNRNGINYGMPYILPYTAPAGQQAPTHLSTLLPIDPSNYYGLASDRANGKATILGLNHTLRLSAKTELTTKLRKGDFERDQRSGTIRFAAAALQPGGLPVSLQTFGPNTVLTRGNPQLKIQDMDTLFAQSDLSTEFQLAGMTHKLQTGVDFANEEKIVYNQLSVAQGGVQPSKPTTTVGRPNDGAWINEDSRKLRVANDWESKAAGFYVQDLIQLAPAFKLLVGTRYDHLKGDYNTNTVLNNDVNQIRRDSYSMKVSEWSYRAGLLFQPNERMSFHFGGATSFNTSGDAYSLNAQNQSIPPEQSINVEAGAKIDSADGRFTTRLAVFRSTKLHERNTDPLLTNVITLSGKRHVAGAEIDIAGKLTPRWEIFASYMWMPVANIDVSSATGGEVQGARPSLTPEHTGSFWTSYQLTDALRVGAGLTARSSQTPLRNPGFAVPKFVTGDLMAEYQLIRDVFLVKLNVSNVTNKLYADTLYPAHYVPGAGRLTQITGSLKF